MSAEKETIRVQLNYPLERVTEPILYHLVMDYHLIPNVRKASVDGNTGGFIYLDLTGDKAEIEEGLKFLEDCGIYVSAIGLDGTQEWAI